MSTVLENLNQSQKKAHVVNVRSGDTVRVHQKIREGNKERVQIFQGLVIRTDNKNSHTSRITVRRISSGVGVEKSFLVHSPLITKIEITKRSKVRRNYLSYMRSRTGKSARLSGVDFDRQAVNDLPEAEQPAEAKEPKEADIQAAETEPPAAEAEEHKQPVAEAKDSEEK